MNKILALSTLFWWTAAMANGGASALDNLILHKKEEIHKTRKARGDEINKELNQFFDELIQTQEKDLRKMTDLRSKLFPEVSPKKGEDTFRDEIAQDLRKVQEELLSLVGKFEDRLSDRQAQEETSLKVEIDDKKKAYEIKADVPDVTKEDIKVSLKNNSVIIEAKRKEEVKTNKDGTSTSEMTYGEMKRVIQLKDKVNAKSMKVDYKDGVVRIHLDKV